MAVELHASSILNFWESLPSDTREGITSICSEEELKAIQELPNSDETLPILDKLAPTLIGKGGLPAFSQVLLHTLDVRVNCSSKLSAAEQAKNNDLLWRLAAEHDSRGDSDQAEPVWRGLLRIYTKKDPQSPTNLGLTYNLGRSLNMQAKYDEAEPLLKKVLPKLEENLGKESQQVIGCLRELAECVGGLGRLEEARALIEEGKERLSDAGAMLSEKEREEYLVLFKGVEMKISAWEFAAK
ncbi:hypothetical protein B0J14DRAFT_80215 [Halenospora varia]|nr:hypothetical protein B0J14DRAFT_80215 [Halenospora varia]